MSKDTSKNTSQSSERAEMFKNIDVRPTTEPCSLYAASLTKTGINR